MSEYPRRGNKRSDPSRWDSADPDAVTKLAQSSINVDLAALQDWFYECKRQHPSIFRNWTIEQFKNWNDQRIADLVTPAEVTLPGAKYAGGLQAFYRPPADVGTNPGAVAEFLERKRSDYTGDQQDKIGTPSQEVAMTRKYLWERNGKRMLNPATKQLEPSQWNNATGDFELIPAE